MSDQVTGTRAADVRRMTFDDNALLAVLYGNHDRNLVRIEQLANVQLAARGNQLAISGTPDDAAIAQKAISGLYERLKRGLSIESADIDAAMRFARSGAEGGDTESIRTRKRTIQAMACSAASPSPLRLMAARRSESTGAAPGSCSVPRSARKPPVDGRSRHS